MFHKNYKDRLFRYIFGYKKENLLSLYNALNNTSYTNTDDLTINTIDDVIYMDMKNDISCIIDDKLTLIEHQSTINNNMPLRGLIYFSRLYNKHIETNGHNIYVEKLIKIPAPQYFVLYNGVKDVPDRYTLYLSDAFITPIKDGSFEWTATVLNINEGHNKEILNVCKLLGEYAIFIALIRKYNDQGLSIGEALDRSIDECINNDVLKDILLQNKAEVKDMCITEFNEEEYRKAYIKAYKDDWKEEGRAEGEAKGLAIGEVRGKLMILKKLVQKNRITVEEAAEDAGMTIEEFNRL